MLPYGLTPIPSSSPQSELVHCSGVKFRNDVPDFSIAVDVAKSIAVHCNAQNGPEKFLAAKEQL